MSIFPTVAKIIIKEHLHKPIKGKVLCLGRQTIEMTHKEAVSLIQKQGCYIPKEIIKQTMILTKDEKTRAGKGRGFISDIAFFKLLGITDITSMDVSHYENADIIHDLNKPVPKKLYEKFDFIIDGGTFDHLFDVRTGFINVTKMLKTDGRIIQWNAASNYVGSVYCSFAPELFYDFFNLNKFTDCKVWMAADTLYLCERILRRFRNKNLGWNFYEFKGNKNHADFRTKRYLTTIVLAEKGKNTTWDKIPTQGQYRDLNLWMPYNQGKNNLLQSKRSSLKGYKNYFYLGKILGTLLRKITGKQFKQHKGYDHIGII